MASLLPGRVLRDSCSRPAAVAQIEHAKPAIGRADASSGWPSRTARVPERWFVKQPYTQSQAGAYIHAWVIVGRRCFIVAPILLQLSRKRVGALGGLG